MKYNGSRSFFGNVFLTAGAEFIGLASNLVVVSLLGWWLGPVALAEYLLLRRVNILVLSGSRAGMGTALPRYVAQSAGAGPRQQESRAYFVGGAVVVMLISVALAAILVAGRREFAAWLFGNADRGALVLALALMLVGLAAHTVVYGYYVGLLQMGWGSIITVWNLAIIPVGVVSAMGRTHSVAWLVGTIAVLTTICSALFSIPIIRQASRHPLPGLTARIRELLRYGIPRVPGDLGNAALLAVGPVVAAHYVSMGRVSSLLLGMTILAVVSYGSIPVRTVLLSQVSTMLEKGAIENVRAKLETLAAAVPEISVFICVQFFIFADMVVRLWVGPSFLHEVIVIRLLILAIPPYMFFTMLRSTIDAAAIKAHNTVNILMGLGTYIVLLVLSVEILPAHWLPQAVAGSLLAALAVVGVLTARTFCRLFGVTIPWRRSLPSVIVATALGGVSLLYRLLQNTPIRPIPVAGLELCLGLGYLTILALFGSTWVRYTWRMALREIHI